MTNSSSSGTDSVKNAIDVAIPLLAVGGLLVWCFRILEPFLSLIVWGGVMAVALFPPVSKLASLLGGRPKLAIGVVVLLGLAILFVPVFMIADSLVGSVASVGEDLHAGLLKVPPPPEGVAEWPLIGERVDGAWTQASVGLEAFLRLHREGVKEISVGLFAKLASATVGIALFAVSLLVAAIFLANSESVAAGFKDLAKRLVGPEGNGAELVDLSIATMRTVATGVLGVAFIQAVLAGIGMILFDIPAAGVIALLVLILAIAQLPPLVVCYRWRSGSSAPPTIRWLHGFSSSTAFW